jgi:hypothetical protein
MTALGNHRAIVCRMVLRCDRARVRDQPRCRTPAVRITRSGWSAVARQAQRIDRYLPEPCGCLRIESVGGDSAAGTRLVRRGLVAVLEVRPPMPSSSGDVKAGTIRPDVAPGDVLASLSSVSLAAGKPAQRDQARRMLDLLMDGLRYRSKVSKRRPAVTRRARA